LASQNKTSPTRISKIQDSRKLVPSAEELSDGLINGDKTALARAITLVESAKQENLEKANTIIETCLTHKTDSIRIGITGVPGVGKSTFIESFGKNLTSLGKKVAVLAVDPTSTQTKGSILGDKTRMQELVKDRETIVLCEAAGYDVILVETVGVGQSETAVHSMVDFFLLLKLPGAGDELQGIKRGIIEMADAIVINKTDGDNVKRARNASVEFSRALHLYPPKENGWIPKVLSCSAIENKGLEEIWDMIFNYISENKESNYFTAKRQKQNKNWLLQTLDDQLKQRFYQNKKVSSTLEKLIDDVVNNKISPFRAAEKLLQTHHK